MTKHGAVRILAAGERGRVVGVVRPDGTCPAEEFLAGLDTRVQTKFKSLLERLTAVGWLRAPELLRDLEVAGEPKVWEVKSHVGRGHRLYLVRRGPDWVATHGGPKVPDRRLKAEARRARDIYAEWIT